MNLNVGHEGQKLEGVLVKRVHVVHLTTYYPIILLSNLEKTFGKNSTQKPYNKRKIYKSNMKKN